MLEIPVIAQIAPRWAQRRSVRIGFNHRILARWDHSITVHMINSNLHGNDLKAVSMRSHRALIFIAQFWTVHARTTYASW